MVLVSFQLTLMVKKLATSACSSSCGSPGEKPKQSGSQQTVCGFAEGPFEVPLAVEELADRGLSGRDIGVGLNPHRAIRLPLAGLHLLLDRAKSARSSSSRKA